MKLGLLQCDEVRPEFLSVDGDFYDKVAAMPGGRRQQFGRPGHQVATLQVNDLQLHLHPKGGTIGWCEFDGHDNNQSIERGSQVSEKIVYLGKPQEKVAPCDLPNRKNFRSRYPVSW